MTSFIVALSSQTASRDRRQRASLARSTVAPSTAFAADSAFERAVEFVEQLMALPIDRWLASGEGSSTDSQATSVRQDAEKALQSALVEHDLTYSAWLLRDALATAEYLVSQGERPRTGNQQRALATARRGAECAALAVLAREYLSPTHFDALCAPVF